MIEQLLKVRSVLLLELERKCDFNQMKESLVKMQQDILENE